MADDEAQLAVAIECAECHQAHTLVLSVEYGERKELGLIFAGPIQVTNPVVPWIVKFLCPVTHKSTTTNVDVPVDRKSQVLRVEAEVNGEHAADGPAGVQSVVPPEGSAPDSTPEWVPNALEHIRTSSFDTGRAFGSTMIATSTTAVGVYFAVIKYLGFEQIGGPIKSLTVAPPVLFLLSAVAFAAAIRPVLAAPSTLGDFEAYWRNRLTTMNRFTSLGMVLFIAGIALTIPIFLSELH